MARVMPDISEASSVSVYLKNNEKNDQNLVQTLPAEVSCRICLENTVEGLIAPCDCRGTSKYVHESCLKVWIIQKFVDISQSRCEVCERNYRLYVISKKKCCFMSKNSQKMNLVCSIPVLFAIFVMISLVLSLNILFYIDFTKNTTTSAIVLVFCLIPLIIVLTLLIKAILKHYISEEIVFLSIKSD